MENLDSQSSAAVAVESNGIFSTTKRTIEKIAAPDHALILAETHPDFIESLATGPIQRLPTLEPRNYQTECLEKLRLAYLDGVTSALAEIGTGAGKTAIALNLIAGQPGKVLWLAPSNAALTRAVDETENLRLDKKCQVLNGKPLDCETDILFSTVGMLNYGEKFAQFDPEEFSLIVFDEGHHSMGKATRKMLEYFRAYHLYLTATPEMVASHLHKFARPVFRYSSEQLIQNDNFPFWTLRRYEVTGEKLTEARVIGDNYALAEDEENQVLNMPHRYAITLQILQKTVPAGEKTISFLPSVTASRKFVEDIVSKHPELKGKVVHVDGKMDKRVVRAIAKEFRAGRILAVCCNDLFTESLDIPDIKHVVLADPCCSPRVLMQRIGRGARPAPSKTHLTIHDVISTVANLEDNRKGTAPLTVAAALRTQTYAPDIVLNGPNKNKVLFEKSSGDGQTVSFVDNTKVETEDLPFHERMIDMTFMSNPDSTFNLFKLFAREHFQTAVENLILYPETYTTIKPQPRVRLVYSDQHETIITFRDVITAVRLYRLNDKLLQLMQDDLDELCRSFNLRAQKAITDNQKSDKTREVGRAICRNTSPDAALRMMIPDVDKTALPAGYLDQMSGLSDQVLKQSKELSHRQFPPPHLHTLKFNNPESFLGNGTNQKKVWQGLVRYFKTSRRILDKQSTFLNFQPYPFRLQKSSCSFSPEVIRNAELFEEECNKVKNDTPLQDKLLGEPDTCFQWVMNDYPQLQAYLKMVHDALSNNLPALYFTPEQINRDLGNFLLFIGTLCGDHSFDDTMTWPEFFIEDIMTEQGPFLAVYLQHLKPEITSTKASRMRRNKIAKDTPNLIALEKAVTGIKPVGLTRHRQKMAKVFTEVLADSVKSKPRFEKTLSDTFAGSFLDQTVGPLGRLEQAWRGIREYFMAAQAQRALIPIDQRKKYPFRVEKNHHIYGGLVQSREIVRQVQTLNAEYSKTDATFDDNKCEELLDQPDIYFAYMADTYPQMTLYFNLVAEALSKGIKVLKFSAKHIQSDPDNFLLFLGIMSGDSIFAFETPEFPEFWISDDRDGSIAVSIKHLQLELPEDRLTPPSPQNTSETNGFKKITKDTPNQEVLGLFVRRLSNENYKYSFRDMEKYAVEVLENSRDMQLDNNWRTFAEDQHNYQNIAKLLEKGPSQIRRAWQGLAEHFQQSHERYQQDQTPYQHRKYPFRVKESDLVRNCIGYYPADLVQEKVQRITAELSKDDNCNHQLVGELLDQPDVYFAHMIAQHPHMMVYYRLVATALSEGMKSLFFTPEQIRWEPESFLLFLGTLAGDYEFGFDKISWREFWIANVNHIYLEQYLAVSLEHLELEIL